MWVAATCLAVTTFSKSEDVNNSPHSIPIKLSATCNSLLRWLINRILPSLPVICPATKSIWPRNASGLCLVKPSHIRLYLKVPKQSVAYFLEGLIKLPNTSRSQMWSVLVCAQTEGEYQATRTEGSGIKAVPSKGRRALWLAFSNLFTRTDNCINKSGISRKMPCHPLPPSAWGDFWWLWHDLGMWLNSVVWTAQPDWTLVAI